MVREPAVLVGDDGGIAALLDPDYVELFALLDFPLFQYANG